MRIENAVYKTVSMKWDTITFPLKAGTPITLGGVVRNNASAIGIVTQNVYKRPLFDDLGILVGGDVYLDEVEESYGSELDILAIKSMSAIRFWTTAGKPSDTGYKLPIASPRTLGGIKMWMPSGTPAAKIPVIIETDGTLKIRHASDGGYGLVQQAAAQQPSEAETLETLVGDFNDLLSALKSAGIMGDE